MRKLFVLSLLFGFSAGAFGQGQIDLDNLGNSNTNSSAKSDGLFLLCNGANQYLPITQDFNVSFYGGSDANSLVLLRTFVGPTAVNDNAFGPGTFIDPSGVAATIPGATTTAYFRIDAWIGPALNYEAALVFRGSSGIFSNPISTPQIHRPASAICPRFLLGNSAPSLVA
jgi:hypothetical protein